MNVLSIVKKYLDENGFDGLCCPELGTIWAHYIDRRILKEDL